MSEHPNLSRNVGIPRVAGIYQIVNSANGKRYIGSTNCLSRRWVEHRKKMRAGISTCTRLQSAWKKYGEDCFAFFVIEENVDAVDLLVREQYWMDELKPEYNVAPVAGSQSGIKHSDKTRALLSSINKITPEQREKMVSGIRNMSPEDKAVCRARQSAAHKGNTYNLGKKASPETRAKMSEIGKRRVFTVEHRARISAALKGKSKTLEHRANMSSSKICILNVENEI